MDEDDPTIVEPVLPAKRTRKTRTTTLSPEEGLQTILQVLSKLGISASTSTAKSKVAEDERAPAASAASTPVSAPATSVTRKKRQHTGHRTVTDRIQDLVAEASDGLAAAMDEFEHSMNRARRLLRTEEQRAEFDRTEHEILAAYFPANGDVLAASGSTGSAGEQQDIKSLEQELERSQDHIASMADGLKSAKAQNIALDNENRLLRERLRIVTSEREQLFHSVEGADGTEGHIDMPRRIAHLEQALHEERMRRMDESAQFENEFRQLEERAREVMQELEKTRAAAASDERRYPEEQMENMRRLLLEARQQLEHRDHTIRAFREQLHSFEDGQPLQRDLLAQTQTLRANLQAAEQTACKHAADADELRVKLAAGQSKIRRLQEQLRQSLAEKARASEEQQEPEVHEGEEGEDIEEEVDAEAEEQEDGSGSDSDEALEKPEPGGADVELADECDNEGAEEEQ